MASSFSLPSFLLFLCLLSFPSTNARYTDQDLHTAAVSALVPPHICNTEKGQLSSEQGKHVLKLVDRYGPCSPFHSKKEPVDEGQQAAFEEILEQDHARVNWINTRTSSPQSQHEQLKSLFQTDALTDLPVSKGATLGTGNFIVTVGLGTPKKDFNLVLDTGSSLSWVPCEPCLLSCYLQQGPRFSLSASLTYKGISCSAPLCSGLKLEFGVKGCSPIQVCVYTVGYGNNSYSTGFLGQDVLTLTSNDVIPQFTFGCGYKNLGLFGMTSGILGLGRSTFSVVSQTATEFGSIFAYCLPTTSAPGSLAFGADPSYDSLRFTPLLPSGSPFYFLTVTGISVGGQRLSISPSDFATPGTIIDSRIAITRLPAMAYSELRAAVRASMDQYPLVQPFGVLDTCYDLSNYATFQYPSIVIHFLGGTDLVLTDSNIFVAPAGKSSQTCLAFAAKLFEQSVAVIGNWQQKTTLVVHDILNNRIGFKAGACN